MYKTIGIVGGMGPAATADLMKKITDMTDADCDQEHIHLLIDSNINIPDRTAAILHGGEDPVPELLAAAKRLESIGADFLIMPCNTAHWFIPALESEVGIPFLNMPVETARLLKKMDVETAAVLATDGTVQKLPHDEMAAICSSLRARGATAVLLACTELPVAFDLMGLYENDCVDPTSVLAGAAIREAGAQLRPGVRY